VKKYGLAKRQVLKSAAQFDRIFTTGRRYNSQHLLIILQDAPEQRVGFAVSKRIRGAVPRNRAKRRLRELYRLNRDRLSQTVEIVMMAKVGFNESPFDTLTNEYLGILQRIPK